MLSIRGRGDEIEQVEEIEEKSQGVQDRVLAYARGRILLDELDIVDNKHTEQKDAGDRQHMLESAVMESCQGESDVGEHRDEQGQETVLEIVDPSEEDEPGSVRGNGVEGHEEEDGGRGDERHNDVIFRHGSVGGRDQDAVQDGKQGHPEQTQRDGRVRYKDRPQEQELDNDQPHDRPPAESDRLLISYNHEDKQEQLQP